VIDTFSRALKRSESRPPRAGAAAGLAAFYLDSAGKAPAVARTLYVLLGQGLSNPLVSKRLAELNARTVGSIARTLRAAIAAASVRADVDPDAQAVLILAGLRGAAGLWLLAPALSILPRCAPSCRLAAAEPCPMTELSSRSLEYWAHEQPDEAALIEGQRIVTGRPGTTRPTGWRGPEPARAQARRCAGDAHQIRRVADHQRAAGKLGCRILGLNWRLTRPNALRALQPARRLDAAPIARPDRRRAPAVRARGLS